MKRIIPFVLMALVALAYVSCEKEAALDETLEDAVQKEALGAVDVVNEDGTSASSDEYCAELAKKIRAAKEGSDEQKKLKALYDEKCGKSDKDYCEELKEKMSKVRKGSDEYNELLRLYNAKCGKSDKDYCEELKEKMSKVRKGSDEYNELLRLYNAKCGKSDKDYCEELKEKMSKVRKGSDEYNELLRLYNAKCGESKEGGNDTRRIFTKENSDEHRGGTRKTKDPVGRGE